MPEVYVNTMDMSEETRADMIEAARNNGFTVQEFRASIEIQDVSAEQAYEIRKGLAEMGIKYVSCLY